VIAREIKKKCVNLMTMAIELIGPSGYSLRFFCGCYALEFLLFI